jgi:hypothetical protein
MDLYILPGFDSDRMDNIDYWVSEDLLLKIKKILEK